MCTEREKRAEKRAPPCGASISVLALDRHDASEWTATQRLLLTALDDSATRSFSQPAAHVSLTDALAHARHTSNIPVRQELFLPNSSMPPDYSAIDRRCLLSKRNTLYIAERRY